MKKILLAVIFLIFAGSLAAADQIISIGLTPSSATTPTQVSAPTGVVNTAPVAITPSQTATTGATALLTNEGSSATSDATFVKNGKYPVASIEKINEYFKFHDKFIKDYMAKVIAGDPIIGMNREMLALIYGDPLRQVEKKIKNNVIEVWVMEGNDPGTYILIGLKDHKVEMIDDYSASKDPSGMLKELSKQN